MDRFKEPTSKEEDHEKALEYIYDELLEELDREPTDEEIHERVDYYSYLEDEYADDMIAELERIEDEKQ